MGIDFEEISAEQLTKVASICRSTTKVALICGINADSKRIWIDWQNEL